MEAWIPGSRLRSEIDIRRGERARFRDGDWLPSSCAWEELRTGIGLFESDGAGEPPVESKKGKGEECDCSACTIGVLVGERVMFVTGMSATSIEGGCLVGVGSID